MTATPETTLRPVTAAPTPCKICGGLAELFDVVDFHKTCRESAGYRFALAGVPVYYRRCAVCGFLFTDAFDDWDQTTFAAFIYNHEYPQVDPDYEGSRAAGNADFLATLFAVDHARLAVLDWGGGDGALAKHLCVAGFARVQTYDPFVAAHASPPFGQFDIVTCFETLEHLPDPRAGIAALVASVAEPGAVLFSTLLQPDDIAAQRLNWWYAAPRNGHISLFSTDSLARAWAAHGFVVSSFNAANHLAWRTRPDFLRI